MEIRGRNDVIKLLGGTLGYKEGTSTSLDDLYYFTPGVYYTRFVNDMPDSIDSGTPSSLIVFELFKDASQAKVLQVFTVQSTGAIYTRVSAYYSNGTDIQHGTWGRQYDTSLLTNQSLLGPLASALGALRFTGDINDCNSLAAPGIYTLGADTQNAPFRYGIVVSFDSNGNINNQIKVAFNASSGHTIGVLFGDGDWAFFDKVS